MNTGQANQVEQLLGAIISLETREEAKAFFGDLLTAAELQEFSRRWQTARLLSDSVPYSQIAAQTGLSSTTIARISKWLSKGNGGYQMMIKRLSSNNHLHRQ